MTNFSEKLNPEAELLHEYLGQYRDCIHKKQSLQRRRRDILLEFDAPLTAINYDGMPHGSPSNIGCAALSIKLDDIERRIREQMDRATKALINIMDIIDFLPDNCIERTILEERYIDGWSWKRICNSEHISRTPATRQWRKGLYALLEYAKVKSILRELSKGEGGE